MYDGLIILSISKEPFVSGSADSPLALSEPPPPPPPPPELGDFVPETSGFSSSSAVSPPGPRLFSSPSSEACFDSGLDKSDKIFLTPESFGVKTKIPISAIAAKIIIAKYKSFLEFFHFVL